MRVFLAFLLALVLTHGLAFADEHDSTTALGIEVGVGHKSDTTFPMAGVWFSKYADKTAYAFAFNVGGDPPGQLVSKSTLESYSADKGPRWQDWCDDDPEEKPCDPVIEPQSRGKSYEFVGIDGMATFKIGAKLWLRAGGGVGHMTEYDDYQSHAGGNYSVEVDSGLYARGRFGLGTASTKDKWAAHLDFVTNPLGVLAGAGIQF